MFPEIYPFVDSSHTIIFASNKELSRNLITNNSSVTLGAAVKTDLGGSRRGYFALLAFSVQDTGRSVTDPNFINENTYICAFVIERFDKTILNNNLYTEWKEIRNPF